jgi:mannosyltransferase
LTVAAVLRSWDLGSLNFWYDEVVTMRLATAPGPAAMLERLSQIDATRAPLHPLLLQGWIAIFGNSESSARSLSVFFGVVTVALVWWIGRMTFDPATGLWSAGLAAVSPLLVYYSRESRMYALLVTLTCLCWGLLLWPGEARRSLTLWRIPAYVLGLTALLYTHPLGLLMTGTLALGSLLAPRQFFGSRGWWVGSHAAALLLAAPWIGRYLDHPPEFLSGRLPIKFLVGTPIGFVGGNGLVLVGLVAVAVLGLVHRRMLGPAPVIARVACLVLWLSMPPGLLYLYSWFGSPIFGPARYTVFVAPAYLILISQGLARLRLPARAFAAVAIFLLAGQALRTTVYAPGLKADWRSFAEVISARLRDDDSTLITVLVPPPDPSSPRNLEVETARYYLPEVCRVVPLDSSPEAPGEGCLQGSVYLAVAVKGPASGPSPQVPGWVLDRRYAGLVVYRGVAP